MMVASKLTTQSRLSEWFSGETLFHLQPGLRDGVELLRLCVFAAALLGCEQLQLTGQ